MLESVLFDSKVGEWKVIMTKSMNGHNSENKISVKMLHFGIKTTRTISIFEDSDTLKGF